MEPEKIIQNTIKAIKQNDDSLIQIIEELKQTNYYSSLPKPFQQMINTALFNNGVFNKLDISLLTDEQKFLICLLTLNFTDQFKNKYYTELFKWYQKHLNDSIEQSNYNTIPWIVDYYQKTPSAFIITNPTEPLETKKPTLNNKYLKYISQLIKIGSCIQFNCPGFVKNELWYLIAGICIMYHITKPKHETFKELIFSIQSFIQLIPTSISIYGNKFFTNPKSKYGLSTQLIFNENKGYENIENTIDNYNFRYQPAFKYLENENKTGNTHITRDETGIRLNTEYDQKQFEQLEQELQEQYEKYIQNPTIEQLEKLLIMWFDSQALTRSTCLSGVLALMILSGKTIKLINDELIDWKAIISKSVQNTYEFKEPIEPIDDFKDLKLSDVLTITKYYIEFIMTH